MSLLQQALEKAKQPENTPLVMKAAAVLKQSDPLTAQPVKHDLDHEPRLDSIKFYETLNKKVEGDIAALPVETQSKKVAVEEKIFVKAASTVKPEADEVRELEEKIARIESETEKKSLLSWPVILVFLLATGILSWFLLQPKTVSKASSVKVTTGDLTAQKSATLTPANPQPVMVTAESAAALGPMISKHKFLLTGITSYPGGNFALINNQVVGVGERLRENALVKAIGKSFVTLELEGQEVQLDL